MPEIAQALEEMDWTLPTDIQSEGIPMILGGGDVLMAAETGSGKTGAFCLPIIQIVHEALTEQKEGKSAKLAAPKASTKWKMNMFDRGDAMAIDTDEGLLCQSRDAGGWHGEYLEVGICCVIPGAFSLSQISWPNFDDIPPGHVRGTD